MRAWVIEPGHGSDWLLDAYWEGDRIVGRTLDENGVGSGLMPDDFRGEWITVTYPRNLVLRTVDDPQREGQK